MDKTQPFCSAFLRFLHSGPQTPAKSGFPINIMRKCGENTALRESFQVLPVFSYTMPDSWVRWKLKASAVCLFFSVKGLQHLFVRMGFPNSPAPPPLLHLPLVVTAKGGFLLMACLPGCQPREQQGQDRQADQLWRALSSLTSLTESSSPLGITRRLWVCSPTGQTKPRQLHSLKRGMRLWKNVEWVLMNLDWGGKRDWLH